MTGRLLPRGDCEQLLVAGVLWCAHNADDKSVDWAREHVNREWITDDQLRALFDVVLRLSEGDCVPQIETVRLNVAGVVLDTLEELVNVLANTSGLDAPDVWVRAYGPMTGQHERQALRLRGLESAERAIQRHDHEGALRVLAELPAGADVTGYLGHTPNQAQAESAADKGREISWGYSGLDSRCGKPRVHDLVLIGARPGIGKTTMCTQWALNLIRKGERVLFVSLEMSAGEIHTKMVQAFAGVRDWTTTELTQEEAHDRDEAQAWLSTKPLRIAAGRRVPVRSTDFFPWLREAAHAHRATVVFIDYVQMVHGVGERQDLRVGDVSQRARLFARNNDLLLVGVVQLNRASSVDKNRAPVLSDMKDSGQLEQDGVYVAMLHHERKKGDSGDDDDGSRQILIRKARRGRLTKLSVHMDGARSRMTTHKPLEPEQTAPATGRKNTA